MGREGLLALIALAATALAGVAAAQETTSPVVGPLRFGMSLEQIKAAAPTATWSDVGFTKHARRLTSIRGDAHRLRPNRKDCTRRSSRKRVWRRASR